MMMFKSYKIVLATAALPVSLGMFNSRSKGLKIVLVGAQKTGKSQLFNRFDDDWAFNDLHCPTSIDDKTKKLSLGDRGDRGSKEVEMRLWDTSGNEAKVFRDYNRAIYSSADGIVIVYDITNKDSFDKVKHYLDDIKKTVFKNKNKTVPPLALVGNKLDLEAKREVPKKDGEAFAQEHGMLFYEVSASPYVDENRRDFYHPDGTLYHEGVQDVFKGLAKKILKMP